MANLRLNQFVALQKSGKAAATSALTQAYHTLQKAPLLAGITQTYSPRDAEGEALPPSGTKLQVRVEEVLDSLVAPLSRSVDLTATIDVGNQEARADVVVDGVTILVDVPSTTLLTLEKTLVDLYTFVSKLPTLDPSVNWTWDEENMWARSASEFKTRSKKIPRNHEKAPATDKHPAQVEVYYEDVVVGDYETVKFSGAISARRQRELVEKITKLQAAVKVAREQANMTEVADNKIGEKIFDYLGW